MAKKEISILIKARNAMAAGIASAYKSLQGFGRSAVNIAKWFTRGFMVAGAAVAGFVAKAVSSYAVQEKAERALASSIAAYGENAAAALPKLKAVAAAIQDETAVGDEATLQTMARLKMLGVETAALGDAARATIALKSVGMEEAAAAKAVAMAMQGQYTMLNRYVPALRAATSDTERAAIVNDLFSRGYQQQKDLLNTTSGAWANLKGRIGDAWEAIGETINQNAALSGWLTTAADKVKELTARFAEFAASDGMVAVVSGIKTFANEAAYNFQRVAMAGKITWASISDALETAGNYIGDMLGAYINVWKQDLMFLADYAVAIWNKIKSPGSKFDPPNTAAVKAAYSELARAAIDSGGVVEKRSKAAYAELDKLREEHANRTAEIAKETADALVAAEQRRVKAAKDANAQIEQGAKKHKETLAEYDEKAAQAEIDRLKDVEKAAADDAEKSTEELGKKRTLFLSKEARAEERAAEKQAAREKRQIELFNKKVSSGAFARGRLSGQSISRGMAWATAEKEMQAKSEAAVAATKAREAAEAKMAADLDRIQKNTADLDSKLDEISSPA